jgi:hypothetical protein
MHYARNLQVLRLKKSFFSRKYVLYVQYVLYKFGPALSWRVFHNIFKYFIRPSDFTVSEDAKIEPWTVVTLALTVRHYCITTRLD